ncbi:winged helix-turn-helix domain-containing protein, partial [Candidatus Bathyarchaeota archaeon]|nr:winged helix-turn-helix domain-containing protein [Candidatus Bathyarchaeota archaeon]
MSAIPEGEIERISSVFDALGNMTRVKIVLLIYETKRPLHIKAVAKALKIDYAALYRHVKVLQKRG